MYGLETGVKERSAGTQKKIVKAAVAETPVRPEAQFDGEWKGKFVVVIDNEGGDLCGFRGKYFDATVKDNEFVAIINQEGNNTNGINYRPVWAQSLNPMDMIVSG